MPQKSELSRSNRIVSESDVNLTLLATGSAVGLMELQLYQLSVNGIREAWRLEVHLFSVPVRFERMAVIFGAVLRIW